MTTYRETFALMQRYTMSPRPTYETNLAMAESVASVPGAMVECGVWRGGLIAGIARLLGDDREYWLFDSFEGLPPVEPIDGKHANDWQAQPNADNCRASEQDAHAAMRLSGATRYHIVKGWFEDTLPQAAFPGGIAFLRADGDWYSSTYQVLDSLFPLVNPGGIISIDDYFLLEGCAKAVHEYLFRHQRPERIEAVTGAAAWQRVTPGTPDDVWSVAFLRKLAP
jgi:O-methyltransferase